jgi:DNA-binding cell septation regulator SpoVG
MFQAWKKSSGHNRNMLDTDFEIHAVAVIEGKQGITCTSMFIAYPKNAEYAATRSGSKKKKSKRIRLF